MRQVLATFRSQKAPLWLEEGAEIGKAERLPLATLESRLVCGLEVAMYFPKRPGLPARRLLGKADDCRGELPRHEQDHGSTLCSRRQHPSRLRPSHLSLHGVQERLALAFVIFGFSLVENQLTGRDVMERDGLDRSLVQLQ